MTYSAKILADSINTVTGDRLTTMEVTYPRFVHSEFMTHRLFSRSSASSRAIPVAKLIQRVIDDPVIPVYWGANQRGMQAGEELPSNVQKHAEAVWLASRDEAVASARSLAAHGVHKQIVNRLLEPWMWITVIVSATEWENFFALRCHKDAQPEIQKIAYMMKEAREASEQSALALAPGMWHLPMVDPEDHHWAQNYGSQRLSAARCARVSYLTHDGKRDPAADLDLCAKLIEAGHWSPLEHPAQALATSERSGNFVGWRQFRKGFEGEHRGRKLP